MNLVILLVKILNYSFENLDFGDSGEPETIQVPIWEVKQLANVQNLKTSD